MPRHIGMFRTIFSIFTLAPIVATAATDFAAHGERPTAAQTEFFEKRVRPVLVERCYECHSSGAVKIRGGLRLDSRDGWARGGDSGPAVVPGRPEQSLLIHAVRHQKQDLEMPPDGRLPEAAIGALEEWIRMGAPDPRVGGAAPESKLAAPSDAARAYWAYQPLKKPLVPQVKDAAWPANEIDRFVLAGLESRGMHPAPEADRRTLIRRLYYDLIGLPPTPEQISDFENDASAGAYERLVDRLLGSPRFGERWGRHWLDVARFGESLTLRGFILKDAWRYRDYVIEVFNEDRPFNQFMQEQVAGDLMPVPSAAEVPVPSAAAGMSDSVAELRRRIIATAFLAIGNTNLEEQDKKQLRMDVVDEQLETISRAFLGQSVGCARCHDHKFDPIPTRDYYALAGILRSTRTMEHANVSKWIEVPLPEGPEREKEIAEHEAAVAALQSRVKEARQRLAGTPGARPASVATLDGVVVDDPVAKKVGAWKTSSHTAGYVGDGYVHDENDGKGAKTVTFIPDLPRSGIYEVRLSYTTGANRATNAPVTVFGADGEKTIALNQRETPPIDGRFVSLGRFTFEKTGQSFVIVSNEGTDGHVIADAVQFLPADAVAAAVPADDGKKAAGPAGADDVRQMEAELKRLIDFGPKRESIISVVEESPDERGDTKVHVRGSVHTLGAPAPRGFLSTVPVTSPPSIPPGESGRLQLAQWLAHPDNPLPARVTANRVWHWLFGAGIVRTVDNFGTTGELPSHPALLDYLALDLVQNKWSVKSLVRRVVLSRTYRMSSAGATPPSSDPENRFLSRMNRRRLDAECIRDAMLAVGVGLDLTMGGPTHDRGLSSDFGHRYGGNRRSVYVPAFRNALPELFEAFDFADPSTVTGARNVSTVAPQALFMLNNPFVREQARHAARRLVAGAEADGAASATRAYLMTLGRPPTDAERQSVLDHMGRQHAAPAEDVWTDVLHALMASVEFRYVE